MLGQGTVIDSRDHGLGGGWGIAAGGLLRSSSGSLDVEVLDGFLQRVAADEPGMLQPTGHLSLRQEGGAAGRVGGVTIEGLLQRHSRYSSVSRATKTAPRPPRAYGRRTQNRWPSLVAVPTE